MKTTIAIATVILATSILPGRADDTKAQPPKAPPADSAAKGAATPADPGSAVTPAPAAAAKSEPVMDCCGDGTCSMPLHKVAMSPKAAAMAALAGK